MQSHSVQLYIAVRALYVDYVAKATRTLRSIMYFPFWISFWFASTLLLGDEFLKFMAIDPVETLRVNAVHRSLLAYFYHALQRKKIRIDLRSQPRYYGNLF